MQNIQFIKQNLLKVEKFLNMRLYSYYDGGSGYIKATFAPLDCKGIPSKEEQLELSLGDTVHKDRKGNIFKQLNKDHGKGKSSEAATEQA